MEELPDESHAWLEARLSRESADQATEGLLANGDLTNAAATLRAQSKGVSTLKGRKRRRAVETLAADSNLEATLGAPDHLALEAIVIASSRPAIPVRDGTFTIESAPWSHLEGRRPVLERAVAATGRIQLADGTVLGTAARVGPGLFMTTRSVVDRFAIGGGHTVQLIAGRNPTMRAESHRRRRSRSRRARASIRHRDRRGAHAGPGVCLSLGTSGLPGHRHRGGGASDGNEQEHPPVEALRQRVRRRRLMPGNASGSKPS